MIKLAKSSFYRESETKQSLIDFISSATVLSMDKECLRFEDSFSKKQERRFSVLVSSGSAANLILIQSMLNLKLFKKGDKIGISSLTWATNVMPLIQLGLIPIALDVNLNTLNVSANEVEKQIKNLKGLFITNVLGLCDNLPTIQKICKKNKIILIEDNCESLGSKIQNSLLGNFGLASTFSFFVGHHLSTIEGGMVCTDDRKLYEMLIMTRAHGWDRNLLSNSQEQLRKKLKNKDFYEKYTFYDLAYNARPTEITGFLGNKQLKYLDEIIKKRQNNFLSFALEINSNKDFLPIKFNHMDTISNMAMPIVCISSKKAEYYKKKFTPLVEIRPIIAGNISQQPFYKKYIHSISNCPNAEFIHKNGFYFANNPELTKKEILTIIRLLNSKNI
jgi:CDP-6-deoxy-D-xylo-4-hexulose-3-dehydrase